MSPYQKRHRLSARQEFWLFQLMNPKGIKVHAIPPRTLAALDKRKYVHVDRELWVLKITQIGQLEAERISKIREKRGPLKERKAKPRVRKPRPAQTRKLPMEDLWIG